MNKEQSLDALRLMLNSRYFEEKTEELFFEGKIHGTTHLANGQEACQAGLCMALDDNDWIVPTHRCHGFTICKGSDPVKMFAEMFGSRDGLAKGLGGSMHMPDKKNCNLGSSAVVGSGVPLATGIGFWIKRTGRPNISVAIFGDGASSRGSVHESMNMASVWKLPVLFFCENNLYGMSARSDRMISVPNVADRAASYSMPGVIVDGNDVEAVYEAVKAAREYISKGNGPYLIEAKTYRQKGHSKSDRRLYRTAEEEAFWLAKDPIVNFEKKLVEKAFFTELQIKNEEDSARKAIEIQAETALKNSGNKLSTEEALDFVYAKQEERQ